MMGYFYIFLTIAFTVYGQIVLKWQMIGVGDFPENYFGQDPFFNKAFAQPMGYQRVSCCLPCFACLDGSNDKAGIEPCLSLHEP